MFWDVVWKPYELSLIDQWFDTSQFIVQGLQRKTSLGVCTPNHFILIWRIDLNLVSLIDYVTDGANSLRWEDPFTIDEN